MYVEVFSSGRAGFSPSFKFVAGYKACAGQICKNVDDFGGYTTVGGLIGQFVFNTDRFPETGSGGYLRDFYVLQKSINSLAGGDIATHVEVDGNGSKGWTTFIPFYSSIGMDYGGYNKQKFVNLPLTIIQSKKYTPFDQIYLESASYIFNHGGQIPQNIHLQIMDIEIDNNLSTTTYTYPQLLNTTYNLADVEQSSVEPIVVQANGKLFVNRNVQVGYGSSGVNPLYNHTSARFTSNNCKNLIIQNGGVIEIGDPSGNRTADVILSSGLVMSLETGGKLIVNDNSRLIIETDAQLAYFKDAEIELNGYNAVIEIAGEINLQDLADFTYTGSGRLIFNSTKFPYNSFIPGNGTSISLKGNNPLWQWMIEVKQPRLLIPWEISTSLENVFVSLEPDNVFQCPGPIDFEQVWVDAPDFQPSTHTCLQLWGNPARIKDCKFANGKFGIQAFQASWGNPQLRIDHSEFVNNDVGLYQFGEGLTLSNSDFISNVKNILVDGAEHNVSISACNFEKDLTLGGAVNGIEVINMAGSPVEVYFSKFKDWDNSIWIQGNATNSFRCNEFEDNGTAVSIIDGGINLSEVYNHGNNQFKGDESSIGVHLLDATTLILDQGFNDFFGGTVTSTINTALAFDGNLLGSQSQILANSNKWSSNKWTTNQPLHNSNFKLFDSNGNVQLIDNSPTSSVGSCVEEVSCSEPIYNYSATQQFTSVDQNVDCTADPINTCNDCPLVITQKYGVVKLNSGLNLAFDDLRNATNLADSAMVMDELISILSTPLDSLTSIEVYLIQHGYSTLMGMYSVMSENYIELGDSNTMLLYGHLILESLNNIELFVHTEGFEVIPSFSLDVSRGFIISQTMGRGAASSHFNSIRHLYSGRYQQYMDYWECVMLQTIDYSNISYPDPVIHIPYYNEILNDSVVSISTQSRVSGTSSIPNMADDQVRLYPNPANNQFVIEVQNLNMAFEIITVQGKVVSQGQLNVGVNELETTEMENGVYLVNIFNSEQRSVKRLIVEK